MATLSGNKIKDTYQSLVKFSDNGNITTSAKQLTDGFGNNSPMYVSTTQVGIGVTPESGLNLHVYGDAKIGSNLTVIGNLVVEGSTTTVGTDTLTVKDPLIVLANNNTSTDAVDIGFYGKYTPSGTTLYSGLFREALTGKYRLFKDLQTEPTTTVNTSGTGYTVADLVIGALEATTGTFSGNISSTGSSISLSNATNPTITVTDTTNSHYLTLQALDGASKIDFLSSLIFEYGAGNTEILRLSSSGAEFSNGITGTTANFSGNVDIDGTLDVDDVISVEGSGFGRIEIGGASGGYIDLKAPNSDDYDFRLITSTGGAELYSIDTLKFYTGATTDLAFTIDASQNATFENNVTIPETPTADTHAASKGYVDGLVEGQDTLAEILANGNTTGGTSIDVSEGDDINLSDTSDIHLGDDNDLVIRHNGTNAFINNNTGQLNIYQLQDDGDIKFFNDDGAGGTENYLQIDGGERNIKVFNTMRFSDDVHLRLGTGNDLRIYHDGTDSIIGNTNGDLYIRNDQNDGDIIFQSDNGSGGRAEYLRIDGGSENIVASKDILGNLIGDVTGNVTATSVLADGVTATTQSDGDNSTKVATTAYVDSQVGDNNELSEVLANGNTTGGTDISVSAGDDITFTSTSKAIFNTALEISEDGSSGGVIKHDGTGGLVLKSDAVNINGLAGGVGLQYVEGGAISLRHNNSLKLATTGSGIDVTGIVKSSGNGASFTFEDRVNSGNNWEWFSANNNAGLYKNHNTAETVMTIDSSGNVGIGRSSSITARLFVQGPTDTATISTSSTPAARINNGGAISNWIGSNGYNYGYIQSIQDDGSNNLKPLSLQPLGGNVGIGTTSPSEKLEVAGNVGVNGFITHNGDSGTFMGWSADDTNVFYTAGNERLRIDSSGNVGINTTSPDSKLDVTGGDITVNTTGTGFMNFKYSGSQIGTIGTDGLDLKITSNSDLQLLPTGNVGIGTDSPSAKLSLYHATDDVSINVNTGTGGSYPKKTGISFGATSTSLGGDSEFKGGAGIQAINTASSNNPTDLAFWTTSGGSPTERMRITSAGNVGIGLTNPAVKLEIQDSTHTTMKIRSGNNDNILFAQAIQSSDARIGTDTNTDLSFYSNASERMRIDSLGKVGIGTTSPDAKLEVVKDVDNSTNTGTDGNATQILHNGNASGTAVLKLRGTGSNSGAIVFGGGLGASTDKFNIISRYNNTKILTTVANGNVGIGTSSPSAKLTIQGTNSTNGGIKIQNSGGNPYAIYSDNNDLLFTNGNGSTTALTIAYSGDATFAGKILVGTGATAAASLNAYTQTVSENLYSALRIIENSGASSYWDIGATGGGSPDLNFYVNGGTTSKLTIDSSGNVGIGTTSPSANLHVSSTGDTILKITSADGNGAFLDLGDASDTDGGRIVYDSGSNLAFYTASTERARIDSSGNIGIGTTSPSELLTLNAVSGAALQWQYNSGNYLRIEADSGGGSYYAAAGFYHRFFTSGSERMRIDSSGRVGISNTSPAYRLDVGDVGSAIRITGSGTGYTQGGVIISSGTSDTPESRGQGIFLFNEGKDVNWYMGTRYGNADEFIISRKTGTSIDTSVATSSNAIITINNSNLVGIGITNPSYNLHVVDTIGTRTLKLGHGNSYAIITTDDASKPLDLQINSQNALRIAASKDIGIGTDAPTSKLDVRGIISTSGGIRTISTTTDFSLLARNSSNTAVYIQQGGAGNVLDVRYGSMFAGQGTSAMLVNGAGNVGIGSVSPDTKLNIEGVKNTSIITLGSTTNDSSWSSGDKIGGINFYSFDGSGAGAGIKGSISYIATSSSGGSTAMTFNTASSSANNIERMRIDASGDVKIEEALGINVDPDNSSSGAALKTQAIGNGHRAAYFLGNSYTDVVQIDFTSFATGLKIKNTLNALASNHILFQNTNGTVGSISTTGTATEYNESSSDLRLKKNISDWNENVLDKFSDLKPKEFNFNSQDDSEDKIKGFIAQNEVNKFPNAYPLVYNPDEKEDRYMFNPSGMVVYLMKAVQELKAEIELLKTQINN